MVPRSHRLRNRTPSEATKVRSQFDVILVRHGPAEKRDPSRWPDDDHRPLSREGVRETRKAARGLARLLERPGPIVTSPAARAMHTAKIMRQAFEGLPQIHVWPELAPGTPPEGVLERLAQHRFRQPPLLIGHEPALGQFIGAALAAESVSLVRLSRAGAARLSFPAETRPGAARLEWLLTREQLERI
ncbi:MAG: histidine phosphatase family protein [Thermoplasmata archaeon]|nr:histidine phosphatase family protein [Thermoplasmata archaeon]MCI4341294.1 histidine phosphatase family protein [Thermoplasmata archaeon]